MIPMASKKTRENIEPLKTAIDMVFSYPGLNRDTYISFTSERLNAKDGDYDKETVSKAVDEALETF